MIRSTLLSILALMFLAAGASAQGEEAPQDPENWQRRLRGHAPSLHPSRSAQEISGKPRDISRIVKDPEQAEEIIAKLETSYSEEEREARRQAKVDRLRNKFGQSLDAAHRRAIGQWEQEEERRHRQARDADDEVSETETTILAFVGGAFLLLILVIAKMRGSF